MAKFNGHKNWNHWNVSLWINNDEGLYNMVRDYVIYKGRTTPRQQCAEAMLRDLESMGITRTPDGAPYSVSSIRAAMVGM